MKESKKKKGGGEAWLNLFYSVYPQINLNLEALSHVSQINICPSIQYTTE